MLQAPPPSTHRCLSASRAHENGDVTGAAPGFGAALPGAHVATVKKSTSRRMKKRGKVPPRFETLGQGGVSGLGDVGGGGWVGGDPGAGGDVENNHG